MFCLASDPCACPCPVLKTEEALGWTVLAVYSGCGPGTVPALLCTVAEHVAGGRGH